MVLVLAVTKCSGRLWLLLLSIVLNRREAGTAVDWVKYVFQFKLPRQLLVLAVAPLSSGN